MELCNIILFTIAVFTLSYARYGKPRNGYDVMQLRARFWKGPLELSAWEYFIETSGTLLSFFSFSYFDLQSFIGFYWDSLFRFLYYWVSCYFCLFFFFFCLLSFVFFFSFCEGGWLPSIFFFFKTLFGDGLCMWIFYWDSLLGLLFLFLSIFGEGELWEHFFLLNFIHIFISSFARQ